MNTECRFGLHYPYKIDGVDYHLVKLAVTKDGVTKPEMRLIKDFEIPYWVTKDRYRNHKQTKSWEEERKLIQKKAVGTELVNSISRTLRFRSAKSLRELYSSPYLYGANISSTTLLKQQFNHKSQITPYSVATYDIETDIHTGEILMATVAMFGKIHISVSQNFLRTNSDDLARKLYPKIMKYLGDKIDLKEWKFSIECVRTEMDVVQDSIGKAHEWKPDFLAIWNVAFDIVQLMKCCDRYGIRHKDLFSDPELPERFRYFKWYEGQSFKITTDGDRRPIPFSEQWHSAKSASSFFIIDAMCVYRRLRLTGSLLPGGYSLDNVLKHELGERKLKFEEANKYSGAGWHEFMQKNYKEEYIVYNIWDTVSMLELEKKTNDLSLSLPLFAGYSDFGTFNSSTKVIGSQIYFYLREEGLIPGTPDPNTVNDDKLLGLRGWISTLPAYMIENNGLKCLSDYPDLHTNIRGMVFDADCISSYPSDITALNVSKETCRRELIAIEGIPKERFMYENMNFIMGKCNSPSYSINMFNLPTFSEAFDDFTSHN